MGNELFTIGHSNHSVDTFIGLLQQHNIQVVADVRSMPYSRYTPHFNREPLVEALRHVDVKYVFLGKELGARSDDPKCYVNGKVQYHLLAQTGLFQEGLQRLRIGIESYRVALMCSEKDPLTCHRTILVCHQLNDSDVDIKHILSHGEIEPRQAAETRLLQLHGLKEDFFTSTEELIEQAYTKQAAQIAYVGTPSVMRSVNEDTEVFEDD